MPVSQSTQDSHEQNIQKQIMNLQEKMRNITYDNEMSSEEKSDQKKVLQEKIQDLNSELRQYQLKKRQEEAEKRKEEASRKQQEEAVRAEENAQNDTDTENVEEKIVLFPESNSSNAILSNSNTKEHLASLQKVRNDLEGKLRTATSEEEKVRLRKRINKVSKGMGVKVQTIKDAIADGQKNVSLQTETLKKVKEQKEDSSMPGKVIITRKRD